MASVLDNQVADFFSFCITEEWSKAIRLLTKLMHDTQESSTLLCNRAFCYAHLELYKHALKDSEKALMLDHHYAVAYIRKGQALEALGRHMEAMAAWKQGQKVALECNQDIEFCLQFSSLLKGMASGVNSAGAESGNAGFKAKVNNKSSSLVSQTSGSQAATIGPAASPSAPSQVVNTTQAASSPVASSENGLTQATTTLALSTTCNDRSPNDAGSVELALAWEKTKLHASDGEATTILGNVSEGHTVGRLHEEEAGSNGHTGGSLRKGGGRQPFSFDLRLSLGISQVNAGRYEEGIALFNKIIEENKQAANAYIGRGTAYALQRKLEKAIADFSEAILLEPTSAEGWKRRAQARAALGFSKDVIDDFSTALKLEPSAIDVLQERGLAYMKRKDHRSAIQDFHQCVAKEPSHKVAWNYLGLALASTGDCLESVKAYKRAVELDPCFKEAWVNMAQAYKEIADAPSAAQAFKKALDIDKRFAQSYRLWGLMRYGLGDHRGALQLVERALQLEPKNLECAYLRASCHHALGDYLDAAHEYDELLGMDAEPESRPLQFLSFYQREIALYTASKVTAPLSAFNLDKDFQSLFKEAWGKKLPPTILFPGYEAQPISSTLSQKKRDAKSPSSAEDYSKLLEAADRIGQRIQNDCPGFLPNSRQHRMAGLAAIQVAQRVSAAWLAMREDATVMNALEEKDGSAGAVSGRPKGRRSEPPSGATSNRGGSTSTSSRQSQDPMHRDRLHGGRGRGDVRGWRDVYNLVVKWRQLSEPCDPVVWVDMLTAEEFAAGFGSHTPILLGQSKVVRYYSNFDRALGIMKELTQIPGAVHNARGDLVTLTEEQMQASSTAPHVEELWDAIGEDFWVTTPCHSSTNIGHVLDGTRLTLQKTSTGFDFSIRTPGTPARWIEYDAEMTAAWQEICTLVCDFKEASQESEARRDRVVDAILRLTFYWYNFMPLARGTAVVGYVTMLGLLLASAMELTASIPKGLQVDWEAILSPRAEGFMGSVRPWIVPSLKVDPLWRSLPRVEEVILDVGAAVTALSDHATTKRT